MLKKKKEIHSPSCLIKFTVDTYLYMCVYVCLVTQHSLSNTTLLEDFLPQSRYYNPMTRWESKNPFSNCNFNGSGLPHARTLHDPVALLYLASPHFSIPTSPVAQSHVPSSPVKSHPSSLRFFLSALSLKLRWPVINGHRLGWEAVRLVSRGKGRLSDAFSRGEKESGSKNPVL